MARSTEPGNTQLPALDDQQAWRHHGDGTASRIVTARLQGYSPGDLAYVDVQVDSNGVAQTSAAGGGGGAVTVADGADVAQGSTGDLSSANTIVGLLKAVKAAVTGTLTVAGSLGRTWTLSSGTDSVSVGNFPATQPVTGTVSVSNFPGSQTVTGTVAATQSGPWSVTVTGETATAADTGPLPAVVKVIGGYDPDAQLVRALRFDNQLIPTVDHRARRQLEEMTVLLAEIRDGLGRNRNEGEER